jgi:hypothetical protein
MPKVWYNIRMKKMPDNAKFPVPSGPHAAWNDQDWYDYWKGTGGRIDNSPPYVNPDPMPPARFEDILKKFLDK